LSCWDQAINTGFMPCARSLDLYLMNLANRLDLRPIVG